MKQLVELQKNAAKFEELETEVIVVFREENSGVEGLEKIVNRTKTEFTLALDLNKESSKAYSPKDSSFDNYVIDKSGIVRKIFAGNKMRRATATDIIEAIEKLRDQSPQPTTD